MESMKECKKAEMLERSKNGKKAEGGKKEKE